ncbi:hypothetical protein CDAR_81001 [Caerostris darwini]|uniref:Uncharacterized protein n=1 Tax=Caerostris darwini TaxID=1538125 RepID=A0AAV4SFI1_9ARAC|nr:hypothetical protein CDAR_81001 [Caerostris darwini]
MSRVNSGWSSCDARRRKLTLPWHARPYHVQAYQSGRDHQRPAAQKQPHQAQAGRSDITQSAGPTDLAENETVDAVVVNTNEP